MPGRLHHALPLMHRMRATVLVHTWHPAFCMWVSEWLCLQRSCSSSADDACCRNSRPLLACKSLFADQRQFTARRLAFVFHVSEYAVATCPCLTVGIQALQLKKKAVIAQLNCFVGPLPGHRTLTFHKQWSRSFHAHFLMLYSPWLAR